MQETRKEKNNLSQRREERSPDWKAPRTGRKIRTQTNTDKVQMLKAEARS